MRISESDVIDYLKELCLSEGVEIQEKTLIWQDGNTQRQLTLPMTFPIISPDTPLTDYVQTLEYFSPTYLVILIRSGSAAIASYSEGQQRRHKVIRKYMVRQSQGKSQLSHLKQKGKSRLGSRIRLKESLEFFEEINDTLSTWIINESYDFIFASCPKPLLTHWFNSNKAIPFDRGDITPVPIHIHQPNLEELNRVHEYLSSGELV